MKSILVSCLTLLGFAVCAADPSKITDPVRADIAQMRERAAAPSATVSDNALKAAHRVFAAVDFKGMTRQEVIDLLGKPDEEKPPVGKPPHSQIIYRFNKADGGWQYSLEIDEHDRITKLDGKSLKTE